MALIIRYQCLVKFSKQTQRICDNFCNIFPEIANFLLLGPISNVDDDICDFEKHTFCQVPVKLPINNDWQFPLLFLET